MMNFDLILLNRSVYIYLWN